MSAFASLRACALAAAALLAAAVTAPSPSQAQIVDQIDGARLEQWRARSGNQLRFCRFPTADTAAFDEAVSRALAERLLLTPVFHDLKSGYAIGSEFAGEDFFVALTNHCDVAMTLTIAPNAYPQEFTVTRPIAAFTYLMVTDDADYQKMTDIPAGAAIGASMLTYGDYVFGVENRSRPADQRWQGIPYGTSEQMLTRLKDGTIEAMIIYAPAYAELVAAFPEETADLRAIDFNVSQTPFLNRGGVMLGQNAFLRIELDAAIDEIVADGTLQQILDDLGMSAYPVMIGGI